MNEHMQPEPVIGSSRVRALAGGLTERGLLGWINKGLFPGPDMIVGNRRLWRTSTITAWMAAHAVAKEAPANAQA